ncbi:sulfite exporter TauE/SafE family protein [Brevibacillus fulvus]|uniref:Probable membrane transporter protein n=1 Tax=Brevibacillus fulvus TaxID=1125967 RepID=A0A938Y0E3_9BACL|nr:sulfite exporter TauE/SafE family protein [Brevibacillus fulvus]MBM7591020.1 putative membrane protein YfcA [Brevibacillus fulvus]
MFMIMLILFLAIGLLAGIIGSLVGLGGGLFFVPALLSFANQYQPGSMTPQIAAATSLLVIAVTALSSTAGYLKQKKVDVQSALLFFIGSAPGSVAGVYLNGMLHAQSFSLLFGLFQLVMFGVLMVKDKLSPRAIDWKVKRQFIEQNGMKHEYGYSPLLVVLIAFFVGVVSSLFGVGGGILMVPTMLVLFRFPPHIATATSMAVIFLSAVVGSVTNGVHGYINWLYAVLLAPGAWVGGKLGVVISARLKGKTIVILLRLMMLGIALEMIGEAIFQ